MEINTDVSPTQFAKFAEAAKSQGKSVSAYLREVIKFIGNEAELTRMKEHKKDEFI